MDKMTNTQFADITISINAIWGRKIDGVAHDLWYDIIGHLKYEGVKAVIKTLAATCHYPPSIQQIVEEYSLCLKEQNKIKHNRAVEANQRLIDVKKLSEYGYCYVCKNIGLIEVEIPDPETGGKETYKPAVRCRCILGKNLAMWHEVNVTKGLATVKNAKGMTVDAYRADIDDVLSADEVEIIIAKNKARRHEIRGHVYGGTSELNFIKRMNDCFSSP